MDDGHTFNYEKKEFIHRRFSFANNVLSSVWVAHDLIYFLLYVHQSETGFEIINDLGKLI